MYKASGGILPSRKTGRHEEMLGDGGQKHVRATRVAVCEEGCV